LVDNTLFWIRNNAADGDIYLTTIDHSGATNQDPWGKWKYYHSTFKYNIHESMFASWSANMIYAFGGYDEGMLLMRFEWYTWDWAYAPTWIA
jgi:hypothetical protein